MKFLVSLSLSMLCLGLISMQPKSMHKTTANNSYVTFVMPAEATFTGSFQNPKGTVVFNENDLSKSKMDICIKTKTIDAQIEERNESLRSADFFDIKKFPEITFKSTKIEKGTAENTYLIYANFTMKGVQKAVIINAKVDKTVNPNTLQATVPINRIDYGVGSATDGVPAELVATINYPI